MHSNATSRSNDLSGPEARQGGGSPTPPLRGRGHTNCPLARTREGEKKMSWLTKLKAKLGILRPAFVATHIEALPVEDQGPEYAYCRVPNRWVDARRVDPLRLTRRAIIRVTNLDTGKSTTRVALGAGTKVPGIGEDGIALDYDAALDLGIYDRESRRQCRLVVRATYPWEAYIWFWDHPDIGYRIGMRFAVWSFLVGLMVGFLIPS